MAYDRYDMRRGPREQSRYADERFRDRERDRDRSRGSDERGFFERAGDEIASWFGDEDDERRRRRDEPRGGRDDDFDRDRSGYRPVTGDYGRSEGMFAASGMSRDDRGRYDRESRWERDESRPRRDMLSERGGLSERGQGHDPHYQQWRQRQIDELDRDYDEYRREHQSKFENDFGSWRSKRQTKRQMLGQIRENMEVVSRDDEMIGTVDRVAGDRIILAKSDPESGGVHHSLSCSEVDRVEGDRVILESNAVEARIRWRDESRERALFEREDQGESGPRALDRSFSGTYR